MHDETGTSGIGDDIDEAAQIFFRVLIVDADLNIRAVSPAYESITAFAASDLIGTKLDILAPGYHEKSFLPAVWAELAARGHWSGEATCRRHSGTPFVAALSIAVVNGSVSEPNHYVIT